MRFSGNETKMCCMFQMFTNCSDKVLCTNPHTSQVYNSEMDQLIITDVNSRQQQ